jgi:hypothetical protein
MDDKPRAEDGKQFENKLNSKTDMNPIWIDKGENYGQTSATMAKQK